MKSLLTTISFLFALSAFADVPTIVSRQVTCEELKASLENYGQIRVKTTFLRIPSYTTVSKEVECARGLERKRVGIFGTKDIRNCQVGVYCEYIMRDIGGACRFNHCSEQ